ncbi:hypothetical protein D3C71_1600820 [compost metagenome]
MPGDLRLAGQGRLAPGKGVTGECPLATEQEVQRATNLAEQVAGFALGQRHGFGQHQAWVVAPAITLAQLQQVAQRQQPCRLFRQLGVQALAALRQRRVQVLETADVRLGKTLQLAALHHALEPVGSGQVLHAVVLGHRERCAHAVEEGHAGNTTGHGRQ